MQIKAMPVPMNQKREIKSRLQVKILFHTKIYNVKILRRFVVAILKLILHCYTFEKIKLLVLKVITAMSKKF